MYLYLIRHAESENNARPLHERVEDPPLTELGHRQAEHLSSWVQTLKFDELITSPVRRALQTTRYITDSTGQHVNVWANVFEEGGIYSGYGEGATEGGRGLSRSDVSQYVTSDSERCTLDESISPDGWWGFRPRETPDQAEQRAATVTRRLIDTFASSGKSVVAVIHADFKRRLLTEMIRWKADPTKFGALQNTGISKLEYRDDRWQLEWLNSVSHLPAELITGRE